MEKLAARMQVPLGMKRLWKPKFADGGLLLIGLAVVLLPAERAPTGSRRSRPSHPALEAAPLHPGGKQVEDALRLSQERYAFAVDGSNDGILDWDLDAGRVFVSNRWKEMLGYEPGEIGDTPEAILGMGHPDDLPLYQAAKGAHFRGETSQFEMEVRMRHKDGSYRWMLSRGRAIRDASGRPVRMAGAQTDITQIKLLEDRLRHESSRDEGTGLFNRRHFLGRLGPAVSSARRHGDPLSLCMADLDFFKTVNDEHGHAAGDEVLRAFGSLMLAELRSDDVAARYGGDEFCILFSRSSAADAVAVLERIRKRLGSHLFLGSRGVAFHATATFGICDVLPGDTAESALARADLALYSAKRLGRDRISIETRESEPGRYAPLALVS